MLDPACGSGNFLYLAILALKDLEHKVNLDAEALGLGRQFPSIGPECVKGIEINPYAAELARVTVWIGEIQWMRRNGFDVERKPILRPLDTIECRDAVLNPDGTEAEWPEAEFIIGNPPFLGGSLILGAYGEAYQSRLWAAYRDVFRAGLISYAIGSRRPVRMIVAGQDASVLDWLPPTPFVAVQTVQCWRELLKRDAYLKHGLMNRGRWKGPPCACLLSASRAMTARKHQRWTGWPHVHISTPT